MTSLLVSPCLTCCFLAVMRINCSQGLKEDMTVCLKIDSFFGCLVWGKGFAQKIMLISLISCIDLNSTTHRCLGPSSFLKFLCAVFISNYPTSHYVFLLRCFSVSGRTWGKISYKCAFCSRLVSWMDHLQWEAVHGG